MRYPLPYAFARTSQLLLEDDGQALTLWHHEAPDASAWSEVMRKHAVGTVQRLDAHALAQRISAVRESRKLRGHHGKSWISKRW